MSARAQWTAHLRRESAPGLRPTRWCVLISGTGSNLASLLETPDCDVRLVVTSNAKAAGCAKARRAGIAVEVAPLISSGSDVGSKKSIDWDALDQLLQARSIDAIFLLGFMRIVPATFIEKWNGRILNLHPSLLPKHPGLKSIERSVAAGDDCGATVHIVVPDVDAGPILDSRVSVRSKAVAGFALQSVETLVHIDEQRLVRRIVGTWRP